MYKNILLTIATVGFIIATSAYAFVTISGYSTESGEKAARQNATRECSNNIPDEDNSLNGYGNTGYSNYTNYPKFDRCMASKGF